MLISFILVEKEVFKMNNKSDFQSLSEHLKNLMKIENYSITFTKETNLIFNLFSNFMIENKLSEYTPEIGKKFVEHCSKQLHLCQSRIGIANNIVRKFNNLLNGLDGKDALKSNPQKAFKLSDDFKRVLVKYEEHCKSIGDTEETIYINLRACSILLEKLYSIKCSSVKDLNVTLLQKVFIKLPSQEYWFRAKPFFTFLFQSGELNRDYSKLIMYRKKRTKYPTIYSIDEISKIEKSIDLNSPTGIRNYAIILLLSRYGIRPCDVARLTFDNIDLENNRIHFIQHKTNEPWEAELIPIVKNALINYIDNVRPKPINNTRLFLTLVKPIREMTFGTIATIVNDLIAKSGVDISNRKHGARVFRASIASNMIKDNTSTEVVRRVIGHSTKYAIQHYAKIDIESLRLCPLEVPKPSGLFANKLNAKAGVYYV